jgi:hypothetical protein
MKVAEYATNSSKDVTWLMMQIRREEQDRGTLVLPADRVVIQFSQYFH